MKYIVASDIHGDSYWAERIIEVFKTSGADKLVLLGDILYHGPRNDLPAHYAPKEVIGILNAVSDKILAVRGNCDAEVDQMVLQFPIMADYFYLTCGDTVFFATHGHKYGPDLLPEFLTGGAVLLAGHTHIAGDTVITSSDGRSFRYLNPGSPSIPKENTKPSYILIENGKADLVAFD